MGCVHSNKAKNQKSEDFLSIFSINETSSSTTSFSTNSESVFKEEPDFQYSWTCAQKKYFRAIENSQTDEMPKHLLTQLKRIFEKVEDNINECSILFFKCILENDKTYPLFFKECSIRSYKKKVHKQNTHELIINHIALMFLFHKDLIQSFNNDNTENTIINLLALSHSLMEVAPLDFIFLDCIMEKFLKKTNIWTDDNAEAIVVYFSYVTNSLTSCMRHRNSDKIYSARENYRTMKQWQVLVNRLYTNNNILLKSKSALSANNIKLLLHSSISIETPLLKCCFKRRKRKLVLKQ